MAKLPGTRRTPQLRDNQGSNCNRGDASDISGTNISFEGYLTPCNGAHGEEAWNDNITSLPGGSTTSHLLPVKDETTDARPENPNFKIKRRLGLTHPENLRRTWTHLVVILSAISFFGIIITFVQATYTAEGCSKEKRKLNRLLTADTSTTLAIVRFCQGVLSAMTSYTLTGALTHLQWMMTNSPTGIRYQDLLALSPTTEISGAISLGYSSFTTTSTKFWSILRKLCPY